MLKIANEEVLKTELKANINKCTTMKDLATYINFDRKHFAAKDLSSEAKALALKTLTAKGTTVKDAERLNKALKKYGAEREFRVKAKEVFYLSTEFAA